MNNKYLAEILNSNTNLQQDLSKVPYLQGQILGILKNIEMTIPEDSRENLYANLRGVRLDLSDDPSLFKENEYVVGRYIKKSNTLCLNKSVLAGMFINMDRAESLKEMQEIEDEILMTLYHELVHMASTTRDEETNYYVSGFQHTERYEDGEVIYEEEFEGMTEGFTELLTLLAFGKTKSDTTSLYGKQISRMDTMTDIVDMERMKRAFFNNRNGMQPIEERLEAIDGKKSHLTLYEDIEREFITEKLYRLDKSADTTYGENLAVRISEQLLNLHNAKGRISLSQIEEATNGVRISEINANEQAYEASKRKL